MAKPSLKAAILNSAPQAAPEPIKAEAAAQPVTRPQKAGGTGQGERPDREATALVGAHLPDRFAQTLEMLKAQRRKEEPRPSLASLQAEALNDLFVKHGFPPVPYEPKRARK